MCNKFGRGRSTIATKIEEIIGENNINNNFYLDLSDILWENIVLEIPIKVVKEGVQLETSSGKGWSVEEN